MKSKTKKTQEELRPEYDFDYSKAVRGKYYKRLLAEGANVVMLEPDVAKAFVDSASVNDALRNLLNLTKTTQRLTKRWCVKIVFNHFKMRALTIEALPKPIAYRKYSGKFIVRVLPEAYRKFAI